MLNVNIVNIYVLFATVIVNMESISPLNTCREKQYFLDRKTVEIRYDDREYQMVIQECHSRKGELADTIHRGFDVQLLRDVTKLKTVGINLPPLADSKLERVEMIGASPIDVIWVGCKYLSYLKIKESYLTDMSPYWLANCTYLHDIEVLEISTPNLITLMYSPPNLQEVIATRVHTAGLANVTTASGGGITIKQIMLVDIDSNIAWDTCREYTWELVYQLSLLPNLRGLSLSGSKIFRCCKPHTMAPIRPLVFNSLDSLWVINWNSTCHESVCEPQLCLKKFFGAVRLSNFYIYIHYHIEDTFEYDFRFAEFSSALALHLQVEFDFGLSKQPRRIIFDEKDYYSFLVGPKRNNLTLTLADLSIVCDCENAWLVRALREGLIRTRAATDSGVTCQGAAGSRPELLPPEQFQCTRYICGACACKRDWRDNATEATCWRPLGAIPEDILLLPHLTALTASHNNISTLPNQLPDTLQRLDLTSNSIWQLDGAAVGALFAARARRVRLAGNPLMCHCDNRLLLDALREHRDQVEDYANITCLGGTVLVKDIDVPELCSVRDFQTALTTAVVSLALTAVLAAALLGAAFYYRQELRIYLFARGWCLFCIQEDEVDSDRAYDVFLSYCHQDGDIILAQLLPTLDAEYKVCIHFRDWLPGELIPTQISHSVLCSRRTVVIISRNFMKSVWGLLEFRTAHISALQEGRVRVIAIILDDVLEDSELASEMKGYLRTNTYLRWGDPWFWDKLRYALPHRPVGHVRELDAREGGEGEIHDITQ